MVDDCDEWEDDWPNDDEANDIMIAYEADDHGTGSGCAAVFLMLITTVALIARGLI